MSHHGREDQTDLQLYGEGSERGLWTIGQRRFEQETGINPTKKESGDEKKLDYGKVPLALLPWPALKSAIRSAPHSTQQAESMARILWKCFRRDPATVENLETVISAEIAALSGPVLEFGAKKYAPFGWEKGIEFSRIVSAGFRHALRMPNNGPLDPDTGAPHDAHLACNLIFMHTYLSYPERFKAFDDRPERIES